MRKAFQLKLSQTSFMKQANNKTHLTALATLFLILMLIPAASAEEENMTEPEWDEEEEIYLISSLNELNWIRNDLQADYKLINDIDASETENWNDGRGWNPIGESEFYFAGSFYGESYTIDNLYIERRTREVGLFEETNAGSEIHDLRIKNANIKGGGHTGTLVGVNEGLVENVVVEANISSSSRVIGGIAGRSDGKITRSSSIVEIEGYRSLGGLVGRNSGIISYSTSRAFINGTDLLGGLVGEDFVGSVRKSQAEVNIRGDESVGGLIGYLIGDIEDSYAEGYVEGERAIGGLVGYVDDRGNILRSYSISEPVGDLDVGGSIGWNLGEVEATYWDVEKSDTEESAGGKGKTTEEMESFYTYRISKDLETGNYQHLSVESESKIIDLKGKDYEFELVEIKEDEESGLIIYEEAEIKVEEEVYVIEDGESFEVKGVEIEIHLVSSDTAALVFDVGNSWDIADVDSFSDSNQSYTWNIVDGESYPFLSWEELEEGNNTLILEITDEDSEPVEDASVQIDSLIEETNSDGEAVFENLHETSYTAIADKEGYHENSKSFQITEEEQTETLTLEEKSSTFEITELDLNPDNIEKGETVQVNTTVNNTGSETGKRNLELKMDDELIGEETIELEEGRDEVFSFEFSKQVEGEHEITAEIFEDAKTETLTVGPELFDLEISKTPEQAGSTTPETGKYTYEEGEAITVEAESNLGWSFKQWNGMNKETEEITLTMDEDKQIEAVFEEDIDIEIGEVTVPKTENGEIEFDYQIVNEKEAITENFTIKFNDREINRAEKTVSEGETLNSEDNNFDLINGDASENAELNIEYAGVTDTKTFKIGAIERNLVEGWNYFSLPIATSEKEPIEEILDTEKIETVWTHQNGEWKNYNPAAPENELNNFEGGKGYLVESKKEFTITPPVNTNLSSIESENPVAPAQNNLDSGFSLIGSYWTHPIEASYQNAFQSLPEDQISSLYGSSEKDGALSLETLSLGQDEIKAGQAYWIAVKEGNKTYTKPTVE